MKLTKFEDYLIDSLKNYEDAKAYLICSVEENDEALLIDSMNLIIKAWGPTEIARIAGGSKQKWNQLKNPTYQTVSDFLNGFGLTLGAFEKKSSATQKTRT